MNELKIFVHKEIKPTECISYREFKIMCKDGFMQSIACKFFDMTPMCLNEDLCAKLFDKNGGKPIKCDI